MKMKTLATLAASGLLAVSLAYVTPALAEEAFDEDVGNQQFALADNSSSGQAMPADMGDMNNANANDNAGNVNANSIAPRQEASAAPQPYDPNAQQGGQQVVQQPGAYQQSASNNTTSQQPFAKSQNNQQTQTNSTPMGQQSANNTQASQPAGPSAPAGDQAATADVPSGDEDF